MKNIFHAITRVTAIAVCMLTWTNVPVQASGNDSTLSMRLKAASAQMADQGNDHFIIAEAVSDGLLKDKSTYNFHYYPGHVHINGIPLPAQLNDKYASLMKNYFTSLQKPGENRKISTSISMTGIVNVKEMLDAGSALRKTISRLQESTPVAVREQRTYDYSWIITEMIREGLIADSTKYTASFNADGVSVNGKRLPMETERKYFAMFVKEAGFTPTTGKQGVVITQGAGN